MKSKLIFFKLLTYLMVFIPLLSLFFLGDVSIILLPVVVVSGIISWIIKPEIMKKRAYVRVWNIIAVFYAFFSFFDARAISHSHFLAVVHMMIFLQIYKLFNCYKDRDVYHLFLLSFVEFLALSVLSPGYMFVFPALLFLIISLIVFQYLRKRKFEHITNKRETYVFSIQNLKMGTGGKAFFAILLLIILVGVMVFIILPRFSIGFISFGQPPVGAVAGFSGNVNLGDIGEIKDNKQIIMRVRFYGNQDFQASGFKYRGIILDTFTGKYWRRSEMLKKKKFRIFADRIDGKRYFTINSERNKYNFLQEYYLRPVRGNLLFMVPNVRRIEGDFRWLRMDTAGTTTYFKYKSSPVLRYRVYSRISQGRRIKTPEGVKAMTSERRQRYLQLPDLNPEIISLAEQISEPFDSAYDKAKAIEDYLSNELDYTTDLSVYNNVENHIYHFLFNAKKGHCEYFASAMAVMLRTINIPSRIVNGFQKGEYNKILDYYIVRQSNAHSWVECFIPGRGWLEFDPTPRINVEITSRLNRTNWLGNFIDSIQMVLDRYVVSFSREDQRNIFSFIKDIIVALTGYTSGLIRNIKKIISNFNHSILVLGFIIISILSLILFYFLKFLYGILSKISFLESLLKKFRKTKKRKKETKIDFYLKLIQLLKKKGFKKSKNITPLEFVKELYRNSFTATGKVERIVELYYKLRFGKKKITFKDRITINKSLKEIKEQPRLKNSKF